MQGKGNGHLAMTTTTEKNPTTVAEVRAALLAAGFQESQFVRTPTGRKSGVWSQGFRVIRKGAEISIRTYRLKHQYAWAVHYRDALQAAGIAVGLDSARKRAVCCNA